LGLGFWYIFYVYIYTHIYVYVYVCVCIYICTPLRICICMCVRIYTHTPLFQRGLGNRIKSPVIIGLAQKKNEKSVSAPHMWAREINKNPDRQCPRVLRHNALELWALVHELSLHKATVRSDFENLCLYPAYMNK